MPQPRFSRLLCPRSLTFTGLAFSLLLGCAPVLRESQDGLFATRVAAQARKDVWSEIPAPADNPVTQAKVELGFRLWFEPRLSGNNKMTCGTCHHHMSGFSNDEKTAAGIHGKRGNRNVPTIYQLAGSHEQFWDGRADSLEAQALGPIENPIEMDARLPEVIKKLENHPYYPQKFQETFGTGVTADGMARALASFERALALKPSAMDRFWAGDTNALTAQQKQGQAIFNSPKGRCVACHGGVDMTDRKYHNVGVGYDKPAAPDFDFGRFVVSKQDVDKGAFKTPTLRNIAKTAPYMHDGSLGTLDDVVAYYNRGGDKNPHLDFRIFPLNLTPEEQKSLVAFMRAFSAEDNLKDLGKLPGIRNPKEPAGSLAIPAGLL